MIRTLAALLSLTLLTACVTADQSPSAKSERLRDARASAMPMALGTAY
jgi:hypothetical protein